MEAIYLVAVLIRDPSSWLQAAKNEWTHPVSREWVVAVHALEAFRAANSKKKPTPYTVPWPTEDKSRIGGRRQQSRASVIEKLRKMNPKGD